MQWWQLCEACFPARATSGQNQPTLRGLGCARDPLMVVNSSHSEVCVEVGGDSGEEVRVIGQGWPARRWQWCVWWCPRRWCYYQHCGGDECFCCLGGVDIPIHSLPVLAKGERNNETTVLMWRCSTQFTDWVCCEHFFYACMKWSALAHNNNDDNTMFVSAEFSILMMLCGLLNKSIIIWLMKYNILTNVNNWKGTHSFE